MLAPGLRSVIPLFDRCKGHSFVPASFRNAAARSGGQGRPQGRRGCAHHLTVASTAARSQSCGTMLLIIVCRAVRVVVSCGAAVVQAPMVRSSTSRPAANLLLDTAVRVLSDQDNVALIAIQLCRGPLATHASLTVAWGEQGSRPEMAR